MKFRKYLIFLSIVAFFYVGTTYAAWCKYKVQINTCMNANTSWTNKSLDKCVCPSTRVYEQVAFQVILDFEFKKLDEEMEKYISDLEKYKSIYFWVDRQRNYIDWINDIHTKKRFFYVEYLHICNNIVKKEVLACMDDEKMTITEAKWFFMDKGRSCRLLVDKKLEIFQNVTFNVLMWNKQQIKADEKKIYDQWERRSYDNLLEMMMINFWYIERVWMKIPSFTYKPY